MQTKGRIAWTAGLLTLLAGCGAEGARDDAVPTRPPPGLTLVPAASGLSVDGSGGREIGFGRDQAGALESMARVAGRAPRAVGCPSGRTAFAVDGLRVVFERGKFVGWESGEASAGRGCAVRA